jgi:hypothetical protein
MVLGGPCGQCDAPSRAALVKCLPCDELYCGPCWAEIHQGRKRLHTVVEVAAACDSCEEGQQRPAVLQCGDCPDGERLYCLPCSASFHQKGKKAQHRLMPLTEPQASEASALACAGHDDNHGPSSPSTAATATATALPDLLFRPQVTTADVTDTTAALDRLSMFELGGTRLSGSSQSSSSSSSTSSSSSLSPPLTGWDLWNAPVGSMGLMDQAFLHAQLMQPQQPQCGGELEAGGMVMPAMMRDSPRGMPWGVYGREGGFELSGVIHTPGSVTPVPSPESPLSRGDEAEAEVEASIPLSQAVVVSPSEPREMAEGVKQPQQHPTAAGHTHAGGSEGGEGSGAEEALPPGYSYWCRWGQRCRKGVSCPYPHPEADRAHFRAQAAQGPRPGWKEEACRFGQKCIFLRDPNMCKYAHPGDSDSYCLNCQGGGHVMTACRRPLTDKCRDMLRRRASLSGGGSAASNSSSNSNSSSASSAAPGVGGAGMLRGR